MPAISSTFLLQFVPIPASKFGCKSNCCSRKYIPLSLAYARTIHKFQGLSAGPVDEGKIPNMFDVIVCDPDESRYEGKFLGLFYTAVSRATTLGDDDGLNSALYFTGECVKEDRIRSIGKKTRSQDDYLLVRRRMIWVQHLRDHLHVSPLTKAQKKNIFTWAESATISYNELFDRINEYKGALAPKRPTKPTISRKRKQ